MSWFRREPKIVEPEGQPCLWCGSTHTHEVTRVGDQRCIWSCLDCGKDWQSLSVQVPPLAPRGGPYGSHA